MAFRVSTGSGGGMGGKLFISLFGLFFACMGLLFVRQEWQSLQETKAMQSWIEVPCTILTSTVKDDGEDFRLEVTYSYLVDGKSYTSDQYGKHRYLTRETIGEIKSIEQQLPVGKTVTGYCNPQSPAHAVLDRPTVGSGRLSLLFTLIFPGFGLLFAMLPWLKGKKKKTDAPDKGESKSGKNFLIIFGVVFALAGLAMLRPLLITPLQKTRDAKNWEEVAAVVVSSKVKSHDSDDSTTYSPYIAYRYEIAGREYFGDQYQFMGGSSSGYEGKANIVRQYPEGRSFTVYVNPENPSESVIVRDAGTELLFGLIPLVFAGVGIAVIIGGFRSGKASSRKLDEQQAGRHVVMLKGKSPLSKAVGISLFAVIWNGIVYLIFKSDAPILFHIIFGLFGVGILLAAIHAILAVFNPRPSVEIAPGNIQPGVDVEMRWRMGGRIERIEQLTVSLQCLRVTTTTSGSGKNRSTRVVKTPLFDEALLQLTEPREMAQGLQPFRIPEEQPSSRPGNHGGIQWQLVFHGTISRWPDLKEEFSFLVYPRAS